MSMPSRAYNSFLRVVKGLDGELKELCQCPLGLITHFYLGFVESEYSGAASVSMPSRAYNSFLHKKSGWIVLHKFVSMPSRACNSFLRYLFKNLGFMRFPEPVFAGICQNILATTVFCAC